MRKKNKNKKKREVYLLQVATSVATEPEMNKTTPASIKSGIYVFALTTPDPIKSVKTLGRSSVV
jgi:pyruvate dehydrogenase complex dehydrogenase (E1) component